MHTARRREGGRAESAQASQPPGATFRAGGAAQGAAPAAEAGVGGRGRGGVTLKALSYP